MFGYPGKLEGGVHLKKKGEPIGHGAKMAVLLSSPCIYIPFNVKG